MKKLTPQDLPDEMSAADYLAYIEGQPAEPTNKYHAQPLIDESTGLRFASRAEFQHYLKLRLLEMSGHITDLKLQPLFVLQEALTLPNGQRVRAIKYRADFSYMEDGQYTVVDVKGVRTEAFSIRERLFRKVFPDIRFLVVESLPSVRKPRWRKYKRGSRS